MCWVVQVLNTAAAGDTLQMNAGYFFRLLEHMTAGGVLKRDWHRVGPHADNLQLHVASGPESTSAVIIIWLKAQSSFLFGGYSHKIITRGCSARTA